MSIDTDSPCPVHPAYPAGVCPRSHCAPAAGVAEFVEWLSDQGFRVEWRDDGAALVRSLPLD